MVKISFFLAKWFYFFAQKRKYCPNIRHETAKSSFLYRIYHCTAANMVCLAKKLENILF